MAILSLLLIQEWPLSVSGERELSVPSKSVVKTEGYDITLIHVVLIGHLLQTNQLYIEK